MTPRETILAARLEEVLRDNPGDGEHGGRIILDEDRLLSEAAALFRLQHVFAPGFLASEKEILE